MALVKGYIEKVIFSNQENGYAVLSLDSDGTEQVCVGTLASFGVGEYIEMEGEFVFHPTYGQQFKAQKASAIMPTDIISIERYLGSGAVKGVGPVMATRIIKKFGDDTLRIMDEEPERLAEIKGISMKKAMEIAASQEEKKDLRNVLIFLGDYGISNALAVKLYGQYGNDIYNVIKENPYQLADEVTGIGFRKADEIAYRAGIDPGSDYRIKAAIIYILQHEAENGNVYLPDTVLKVKLFETLRPETVDGIASIEDQDIERCLSDLQIESRVIIKERKNVRQVYYSLLYYTELDIARRMNDLNKKGKLSDKKIEARIEEVEKTSDIILDECQRDAVKTAANSGVLIITGGPGTGKTTTINALIKYFEPDYQNILLAAPTGRAAKRMTEATGFEAKTIHRLLEISTELSDTSAGARFNKNEDCPLEADVLIVDEMSMVDIYLMSALARAITPGTRLILVGDVDQLPSVGPGNVLRDLIESERFSTVRLTKIFRQATESDIIVNAHKINHGEKIELKPNSRDFIFIKRNDAARIKGCLHTLLSEKLPPYVNAQVRDIQVLSPVKKGALGVESINVFLQEKLNPPSRTKRELPVKNYVFREGDKVMHIKNNYDLEWEMRTKNGFVYEKGTGVFNGDIGIIEKINEHTHMVGVAFDDGRHAIYEQDILEELTLSYASTIHKAQGSEYAAVVIPLLSGPPALMNRNILYTAVTRAKSCVVIVGDENTVYHMIENTREMERYSGLKERLLEI